MEDLINGDFIPVCCDEDMQALEEGSGPEYLAFYCQICEKIRILNASTGEDITDEIEKEVLYD